MRPGLSFSEYTRRDGVVIRRYRLDNDPVPSVTTIMKGGLPTGQGLIKWYAKVVAEAVAEMPSTVDEVRRLGKAPLIEALRAVPDERRDTAAQRGTEIHALAEAVVHNEPVEVPPELLDAVQGYVLFLDASALIPLHTERLVASRAHRYAGRFDLIGDIRGQVWGLDIKTSAGVYPETACQVAAYMAADFMLGDDGQELPLPHVDRIGVLHVQPDGTDLYDLGDPDAAFAEFLAAKATFEGTKRRAHLTDAPVLLARTGGLW